MHCEHFKLFLLHWHHFHVSTWRVENFHGQHRGSFVYPRPTLAGVSLGWLLMRSQNSNSSKDGDVRIGWMFDQNFLIGARLVTTLRKEKDDFALTTMRNHWELHPRRGA